MSLPTLFLPPQACTQVAAELPVWQVDGDICSQRPFAEDRTDPHAQQVLLAFGVASGARPEAGDVAVDQSADRARRLEPSGHGDRRGQHFLKLAGSPTGGLLVGHLLEDPAAEADYGEVHRIDLGVDGERNGSVAWPHKATWPPCALARICLRLDNKVCRDEVRDEGGGC